MIAVVTIPINRLINGLLVTLKMLSTKSLLRFSRETTSKSIEIRNSKIINMKVNADLAI
jgi:hypothetical protein